MNSTAFSKNLRFLMRLTVPRKNLFDSNCKLISNFQKSTIKIKEQTFSRKKYLKQQNKSDFEKKESNYIKPQDSNPQFSNFITSSRNDPDNFGTLSDDWSMEQKLSEMPDEEGDVVETEFLFNTEGKRRLTINQYAKIMKTFIKQKKIGHAIEVLETRMLKEDRAQPDNYIYNLLIGACGEVGYTKKAFNLFKKMRDRHLKVTGHTYVGLFNACANSPYPEQAKNLANNLRLNMLEKGVLMNQKIYHSMIKAFGRCSDLDTAFILVDEMLEKKIVVTDETFCFLLQACITDKSAGFRHALLVWWKMKQRGIRPNLYTFNLLLRCSRDCGLGDETATQQVIQVLLQSTQKRISDTRTNKPTTNSQDSQLTEPNPHESLPNLISRQPTMGNIVAVSSIAEPQHRLMLMGGADGFLEQMSIFNVSPDIKTFTQLLDQLPSTLADEQKLLDAIKRNRVHLDVDFCNMLIRKRCLRADYDNAKEVLKLIQSENLTPDIATFGVLAMACQSLVSARQLLQDIENVGYRPNVYILGSLLKNGSYLRDCDFMVEMMQAMKDEGVKPDEKLLDHLDKFHRNASNLLKKQETDDTGMLRRDSFEEYSKYYRKWRKEMSPDEAPHPWSQFKEFHSEPEDLELMNRGRAKLPK